MNIYKYNIIILFYGLLFFILFKYEFDKKMYTILIQRFKDNL